MAVIQLGNFFCFHVKTEDLVADLGVTKRQRLAHIAHADYANNGFARLQTLDQAFSSTNIQFQFYCTLLCVSKISHSFVYQGMKSKKPLGRIIA